MNVLIVAAGYLPGYKYGGPVRSLAALVDQLGDEIHFSVVTMGFDLGEIEPYPGVHLDRWTRVGKANVWYMSESELGPTFWRSIVSHVKPDVIYLNSVMWPVSSSLLSWRKIGVIPKIPVLVAPRGELASSALQIKSRKKNLFLRLSKLAQLHKGLQWQASSDSEANDIRREIGDRANINIAPDLVSSSTTDHLPAIKQAGTANMCWLGRIAPVKNVSGALKILSDVKRGQVLLAAYGPIEVEEYWQEVQETVAELPDNITFEHHGPVEHSQVDQALQQHHFFFFPTLGENFGHVIAEALNQGLPVIVSDQTPWRNLEAAGVGWDLPLDDADRWTAVINHCIDMDDDEYQGMSARCRGYVDVWMEEHGGRRANLEMFRSARRKGSES